MLKLLDRVLTALIDWLYLKRTLVRLVVAAKQSAKSEPYNDPQPETVDAALAVFHLERNDLSVRMGQARHRDAVI